MASEATVLGRCSAREQSAHQEHIVFSLIRHGHRNARASRIVVLTKARGAARVELKKKTGPGCKRLNIVAMGPQGGK